MKVATAVGNGIERLARLAWRDDWHGAVVSPVGGEVACPLRAAAVDLDTCTSCARLLEVRTLADGGGMVQMVICQKDQ